MITEIALTLVLLLPLSAILLRILGEAGVKVPNRFGEDITIEKNTPSRRETVEIFILSLGIRLLVLAVGLGIVLWENPGASSERLGSYLGLWDSRHYLSLIEKGYIGYQENGEHIFLVFYPGYVWLTRLVRLVIPNTAAAGLFVSVLCYAFGSCYVYKIARLIGSKKSARDTVLILGTFPFSFFFGTVMTESLFLLASAGAVYHALRRQWIPYALWGIAAALTRMMGLLVIIPAITELMRDSKIFAKTDERAGGSLKKFFIRLPLTLLPLAGAAVYLLLNWYVDGDPLAFTGYQEHWYQGSMPVPKVLSYLLTYLKSTFPGYEAFTIWLPEILLFIFFFAILAAGTFDKGIPAGLLAFGYCYLILNYSLSWLLSAGRYLSCGFVFFLVLGRVTEKKPVLRVTVLALGGISLLGFFWAYLNQLSVM